MKYFTIQELCKTSTGIQNIPTQEVINNMNQLVDKILDPLREAWGNQIIITSGYRCPKVNKAVGGAKNSQHCFGQAADIKAKSGSKQDNERLFNLIIKLNLPFDQLINEHDFSWIHVSFSGKNRRQILKIR